MSRNLVYFKVDFAYHFEILRLIFCIVWEICNLGQKQNRTYYLYIVMCTTNLSKSVFIEQDFLSAQQFIVYQLFKYEYILDKNI